MKRILSVVLCVLLLFCFAACDEETDAQPVTARTAEASHAETTLAEPSQTNEKTLVFDTENIKRITFYAYYGNGKGSDVPVEHLDEIITWLDSFTIDKEVPELIPPGTNTIKVEIEYFDGTIVKKGLDTTTVDGITYYIKGDNSPACYEEIISRTSLN